MLGWNLKFKEVKLVIFVVYVFMHVQFWLEYIEITWCKGNERPSWCVWVFWWYFKLKSLVFRFVHVGILLKWKQEVLTELWINMQVFSVGIEGVLGWNASDFCLAYCCCIFAEKPFKKRNSRIFPLKVSRVLNVEFSTGSFKQTMVCRSKPLWQLKCYFWVFWVLMLRCHRKVALYNIWSFCVI